MVKVIITPHEEKGRLNIHLQRTYAKKGTNGNIYINGVFHCHSIELPWKNNLHRVSCIPEGVYELAKRKSAKFGNHIHILDVPDRDLILIHAANNAAEELKGCIAPVTALTAPGCGSESRKAFESLRSRIYEALEMKHKVQLTIFSDKQIISNAKQMAKTLELAIKQSPQKDKI